jgi:hypothetical protein
MTVPLPAARIILTIHLAWKFRLKYTWFDLLQRCTQDAARSRPRAPIA